MHGFIARVLHDANRIKIKSNSPAVVHYCLAYGVLVTLRLCLHTAAGNGFTAVQLHGHLGPTQPPTGLEGSQDKPLSLRLQHNFAAGNGTKPAKVVMACALLQQWRRPLDVYRRNSLDCCRSPTPAPVSLSTVVVSNGEHGMACRHRHRFWSRESYRILQIPSVVVESCLFILAARRAIRTRKCWA